MSKDLDPFEMAKNETSDKSHDSLAAAQDIIEKQKKHIEKFRVSYYENLKEIKRLKHEVSEADQTLKDSLAVVRPVARPVRMRKRHYGLVASFAGIVLLPIGLCAGYLYAIAADQYASTMAFTVRSEDVSSSAADLLGGIGAGLAGGVGGSTGTDADILYEFMHSPDMVRRVLTQVDLPQVYGVHLDTDPVFAFDPDGTIEDLTGYWTRMVTISYDSTSRLMEVTTRAFTPEDARTIAETIFAESSRMINELSDIARIDGTRYAQEDLDTAVARLKSAREALTQFRLENEIVDVDADIQSQMGLLAGLQTQQTEALIELDLLTDSARPDDPRLDQAQRRLAVIEQRIAEERRKFGAGGAGPSGESYANTVAQFESLSVDREFAELAYASALSAFDTAKAEANRQSRYLAAYITPTLAQQAEYPRRLVLTGTVALFALLIWIVSSLVYYALRERR
ncbi:capsular polysaccharide transport system permease protein [Loktanella fryxellensis]|uniref:Capsular polysaccharide transport system permease protein n=1 Tax=Loktanella fryxellensis TaxID=245187 RepID=A0A1H8GWZ4_9RHOB|nr:sugar transporter [Loktanella fryxellensis]SEN47997.1 capsular polysaccharide transport system permease protein [Loktanella fryxellensis]